MMNAPYLGWKFKGVQLLNANYEKKNESRLDIRRKHSCGEHTLRYREHTQNKRRIREKNFFITL